ncbi:MAG: glycosyltransferase family 39 protein [Oscillatoriales cyanobacterium]|nr:MAG: glycosyltransferase family 39 protein [Oscillatoriales cyanobacterium]
MTRSPFSRSPATSLRPALLTGLGLTIVATITLVYRLGSTGLIDETEPLFAEAARQMAATGDWITPYYNDVTRFDKPPLVYWLMAIGYRLMGVNEWMVRLPSAIAAIGLMTLACLVVVRCVPPTRSPFGYLKPWFAGGLAGSITVLNLHTLVWGRTGVSDMLLSGCMGGAMLAFFMGYRALEWDEIQRGDRVAGGLFGQFGERSRVAFTPRSAGAWFGLFYVLLALAVLTKGPVGLVLPGLIILSFLLLVGRLRLTLRSMGLWWGIPLFLVIVVPWFGLVIAKNGQAYIDSFFGYHNLARFTSVVNRHSAPWYFYVIVIGFGFFPWSAYLPATIARFRPWHLAAWRRASRSQQLPLFALCWLAGIFLFFSLAVTKLPSYVLPLMPAGAILVAIVLADATFGERTSHLEVSAIDAPRLPSRWLILGHGTSVVLWLGWTIALWTIPLWYTYDPAVPKINQQLIASGVCQSVGIASALITLALVIVFVCRRSWIGSAQVIGFCCFTILSFHPLLNEIDRLRQLPLRDIASQIQQVRQSDEPIALLGFEKPSLVFYLQDHVTFLDRVSTTRAWIDCLSPNTSALLITDEKRQDELELPPDRLTLLGEHQRYRLLRIATPSQRSPKILTPQNCVQRREH